MEKRVVITGMGTINPIGNNLQETWESIKNKKCGIDEITLFDTTNFKTKLAAEVKNFDPAEYLDVKQSRRLDRNSQFAIIAAREAFKDSGITQENTDFERTRNICKFWNRRAKNYSRTSRNKLYKRKQQSITYVYSNVNCKYGSRKYFN